MSTIKFSVVAVMGTLMGFIPTKENKRLSPTDAPIENFPVLSVTTVLFLACTVTPPSGALLVLLVTTPVMVFCCAKENIVSSKSDNKKNTFLIIEILVVK